MLLDHVHVGHLFTMVEIDESSVCRGDKINILFRNIFFLKDSFFFLKEVEVCSPLGLIYSVLDMCRCNGMSIDTVCMSPQNSYFHKYLNWSCSCKHHISFTLLFSLMLKAVANLSKYMHSVFRLVCFLRPNQTDSSYSFYILMPVVNFLLYSTLKLNILL